MPTPKHSVCYVKRKNDYSVATNNWRTANTLKAFINQSLGFSKEFRMLFLSIYQPIQHNDKKNIQYNDIWNAHTQYKITY